MKSKSYFEEEDSTVYSSKMRFTRSCNESNEAHSWEGILVSQQHADAESPDNFDLHVQDFLVSKHSKILNYPEIGFDSRETSISEQSFVVDRRSQRSLRTDHGVKLELR